MKDFPIPVVAIGPGTQLEDETLQYMEMPQGMATYQAPRLPEPDDLQGCASARATLDDVLAALDRVRASGTGERIDLGRLPAADRQLVNQMLGEGEVSAVVRDAGSGRHWQIQESVYAGVWRVVESVDGIVSADTIEMGSAPQVLRHASRDDVRPPLPAWQGSLPPNVQNAPALLAEITDHSRTWRSGEPARVVNLTLLPMSPEDIAFLDHHLGTGRVLILSRGYGNCRITNTTMPNCWRVVYYNSQDAVILNTVEVCELPEVALAAREDLDDARERLAEVLAWMDQ